MTLEERIALRDELFVKLKEVNVIKSLVNDIIRFSKKKLYKFLNDNGKIKDLYDLYVSEFRSEEEAIHCLLHKDDYTNHICPICEKDIKIFYANKRHHFLYRNTCGKTKCLSAYTHSKEANQKRINTNQKERGCDWPTQDPVVVQKGKDTKRDRYGDENYNNSEKREETCKRLYDDPHYTNREQAKETCRKNHGVDYYVEADDFQEKAKIKKKEKYGDENYNNRDQAKKTCEANYGPGIDNPMKVPEIVAKFNESMQRIYEVNWARENIVLHNKAIQSTLEHLKVEYPSQSKEVIKTWKRNYQLNHSIDNPIILKEIQLFLNEIKEGTYIS